MRITAWNCSRAFHRKFELLETLQSDISVVSECAHPDILKKNGLDLTERGVVWTGEDPHKGLLVYAKPPYRVSRLSTAGESLPIWAVPLSISADMSTRSFDLLAVWSFWLRDKRNAFGNPTVDALGRFSGRIDPDRLVVAGDFNTNKSVDKKRDGLAQHIYTELALRNHGLESAYHFLRQCPNGSEPDPTYWHYRRRERPFHLDYIYAPKIWLTDQSNISIGAFDDWIGPSLSDHAPITLNVDLQLTS